MYTIFINDKPLFITKSDQHPVLADGDTEIKHDSPKSLKQAIDLLENSQAMEQVYLSSPNPEQTFNELKDQYELIEAAGGLVKNKHNELLFILRNGKWDLPKGKMEKGETPEESALREVEEECGITRLILKRKITNTYHTYRLKNKNILKITYWFEMSGESDKLVPQIAEGITEVKWMKPQEIENTLTNTFRSIIQVIDKYNER